MLANEKISKVNNFMKYIFLALFTFYTILGTNNVTYGSSIISYVMWPTFLLGAITIFLRLIKYKSYIKMPGLIPLISLLLSFGISILINYNYSFKANFITLIYWVFFFLAFFLIDNNKSAEKSKKEVEVISICFIVYSLTCTAISLYMMFTGVSDKIIAPDTGYEYYQGFAIGRLWGVYINPNNGATTSALAIFMLVYFIITKKAWWSRVICSICIFANLLYIALSDSRTGAVCIGAGIAVFFLSVAIFKLKDKKLLYKAIAVVCSLIIAVGGFLAPRKLKDGYNFVVNKINQSMSNSNEQNSQEDDPSEEDKKDEEDKPIGIVDRGYDTSDDISNRRFDVWLGSVQLFAASPKSIIFGYTYGGFTDQAKIVQPDNYLVNNDFGDFTTLDNEVFNILVSQGTLGILAFAALVIVLLVFCFRNFLKVKKGNQYLISLLLASLLSLSCAAMFASVMFYHLSPNTVLFWCLLGYLVHILKKSSEDTENA